jgi:hypothetical protein
MPIVWLSRPIVAIKNKTALKTVKKFKQDSFASDEAIKKRNELYEQWGLYHRE